jgi:hypothetical protein
LGRNVIHNLTADECTHDRHHKLTPTLTCTCAHSHTHTHTYTHTERESARERGSHACTPTHTHTLLRGADERRVGKDGCELREDGQCPSFNQLVHHTYGQPNSQPPPPAHQRPRRTLEATATAGSTIAYPWKPRHMSTHHHQYPPFSSSDSRPCFKHVALV